MKHFPCIASKFSWTNSTTHTVNIYSTSALGSTAVHYQQSSALTWCCKLVNQCLSELDPHSCQSKNQKLHHIDVILKMLNAESKWGMFLHFNIKEANAACVNNRSPGDLCPVVCHRRHFHNSFHINEVMRKKRDFARNLCPSCDSAEVPLIVTGNRRWLTSVR